MVFSKGRPGRVRAVGLALAGILVLGMAGCRTASLTGAPSVTLARADDHTSAEPLDSTWVRTKASYERAGLGGTAWVAVAEPTLEGGGGGGGGGGDLAKAAQNPIANLISVPLQNNTSFGIGPHDRVQNVLNFQPVYPIGLGCDWTLVNRAIIPFIHQPNPALVSGGWTGLGDMNLTTFVVPPPFGKVMVGAGPVILFPTASNANLGQGKWGLGPSFVVVATLDQWVVGGVVNNIWSLEGGGGSGDPREAKQDINAFYTQVFVNYNLAGGWYLVSAPIITADWNAPSDNRWIVPVGGGAGKIFKIGKQPFNASVQAYYNVVTIDNGPEWSIRVQLTALFPK